MKREHPRLGHRILILGYRGKIRPVVVSKHVYSANTARKLAARLQRMGAMVRVESEWTTVPIRRILSKTQRTR